MTKIHIREIQKEDNAEVAKLIRKVLIELGVPKIGTAYEDVTIDKMFETYNHPNASYYVVVENHIIIGCAGVAKLAGAEEQVCELQKMYFLKEARGRGIGNEMMQRCLKTAKHYGYTTCYLETMPNMKAAQQLYLNSGFRYLDKRMGDTGHYACPVWMCIDL